MGVWGCSARCCWLCQHCDGNEFANKLIKNDLHKVARPVRAGASRSNKGRVSASEYAPGEGGGRKGGGTSSPSQGGIEEQCSAQRCSEHLHTCGQPRVTQAPAGITQHRGGAAHITPPPAFFGRAAWRVSTGNKALHGLFCRTTRRAFLFYPKMWPRLPWGGREAPKDTDFAPPPSPDSCMELTAWMFSMLPSRTLLMTFYCYYQSPCKEPWDWSSSVPPSWGQ